MLRCIGRLAFLMALVYLSNASCPAPVHGETERPQTPRDSRLCSIAEFSFGLKAGAGFSQHTGTEVRGSKYTVSSQWRPGFAAGAFLFVPVTSRFGLQQEIMYVQKGSRQDIGVDILDIPTVLHVTYDMDYLEIPVLTKFLWFQSARMAVYSMAGTALSIMVRDRYTLAGEIDDGVEVVPLRADSDLSEVDMFDYSFVYGLGVEASLWRRRITLEHRFVIGWNTLSMPTYAYVPFGEEQLLIENDPVPLKNQAHLIIVGVAF